MTNQEAIKRIEEHIAIHKYRESHAIHIVEALEMAISALHVQDSETRRICDTCKYDPPSKKWPCVDCDMRDPADRWDQQELSKNSTELDKKNGELQPTCNNLATNTISRKAAIDAVDSETVSTNPERFKSSEKFIKFMDDADIASFGKWQWANGFNTAVVAAKIQLKKLPSTQPEIVRCKDCRYDHDCNIQYHAQAGDEFYCGAAERRTDG